MTAIIADGMCFVLQGGRQVATKNIVSIHNQPERPLQACLAPPRTLCCRSSSADGEKAGSRPKPNRIHGEPILNLAGLLEFTSFLREFH
jgi:hypothetical protein